MSSFEPLDPKYFKEPYTPDEPEMQRDLDNGVFNHDRSHEAAYRIGYWRATQKIYKEMSKTY